MSNMEFLSSGLAKGVNINVAEFPNESARMAMCVLVAGPMHFAWCLQVVAEKPAHSPAAYT